MSAVPPRMHRQLDTVGASALGLGSILGSGVFVGLGLVAGVAGAGMLIAVLLAGFIATANGLSSAQLAAAHPVSGGSYEYGYLRLRPWCGFIAGITFLIAKSASAATGCLALAGHALDLVGWHGAHVPVSLTVLALATAIAMRGVRLGAAVGLTLVTLTILALALLAAFAFGSRGLGELGDADAWQLATPGTILHATALAFVAYTGYGRIATMGEEVRDPKRTIPRAIVLTLAVSVVLYVTTAAAAIAAVGPLRFHQVTLATGAPLELVARETGPAWLPGLIAVAALGALFAVVLNLLLGLSRMALAMARRGDLPRVLAKIDTRHGVPRLATLCVSLMIAALVAAGDLEFAWSLSAFTVLVYYSVTNLAAMQLEASERFAPRALPWLGLCGCVLVAAHVDVRFIALASAVVAAALVARALLRRCGE